MGMREFLNGKPIVAVVAVTAVIAVCGWVIYGQMAPTGAVSSKYGYYSTDDGKTLFTDLKDKLAPFEHQGQQAVRVRMFRCLNDKEPFVGYLERFTPKGKATMETYRAESAASPGVMPASAGAVAALGQAATEVKKPGGEWVIGGSAKANAITQVTCADGSGAFVAEVK